MFLRHFVNKSEHYNLEVCNVKIIDRNRLVFDKCLKTITFTRYAFYLTKRADTAVLLYGESVRLPTTLPVSDYDDGLL